MYCSELKIQFLDRSRECLFMVCDYCFEIAPVFSKPVTPFFGTKIIFFPFWFVKWLWFGEERDWSRVDLVHRSRLSSYKLKHHLFDNLILRLCCSYTQIHNIHFCHFQLLLQCQNHKRIPFNFLALLSPSCTQFGQLFQLFLTTKCHIFCRKKNMVKTIILVVEIYCTIVHICLLACFGSWN